MCASKRSILKKALITVPVVSNEEIVQIPDERNLSDVKATALKLVEVFRVNIQYPFNLYILCYSSGETPEPAVPISPGVTGTPFDLPTSITSVIEYTDIFRLFIECLKKELDWEVLKCVLENLPLVLQNKTLILSTRGDLIDELCHHLASMVNDRSLGLPEKLKNLRPGFTRADFHTFVFPVLAAMVTYHEYLDRNRQRELIKCLEFGFVSKCAKGCVSSLRICTLEMQDVMMRLLPLVLLSLSKISATISMAIPVLAFLSSIVRLPKLYANFVEDQYMSVFAIALPYTNPFKFSHYTVSLAHHVIAVWFIRCRLPFRKGFVKFIHTGLKANVLQQFEENSKLNLQNQDSSDRGRSGSYTAGTRTRRRMASGSAILPGDQQAPIEEKMSLFHKELTETCTDMMARYTFGNVSTTPQRSPVAQFLLKGGQSQTWLVGNKIITITTSGGGTKTRDNGLCEKCITLYQETQETRHNTSKKSRDRRRHKSTACLSRSHSQVDPVGIYNTDEGDAALPRRSQDDLSLINDDAFSTDSRDDVGVQTGSSLLGSGIDKDPIESLLFGNKGPMPEKRAFSINQCNCWCTGWAEILIRAPSGNMSWMMRIENETSIFSQQDMSFSDLTLLFAPLCKRPQPSTESDSIGKIDSESLGEDEYESIYSKHFPTDQKPEDPTIISNEPKKETKGFLVPDPEPESTISSEPIDLPSPSSLRKTNSSPSLIGSYPDDGIMKENKSSPTKNDTDTDTIEQISPQPLITSQKIDTSPPQNPDILPSASEKSSLVIKKSKPVKPVKRNLSNSLLKEIEEAEVATETDEDILIQSDKKEEENVFSDMKDTIPPQMKYVQIDSNKLTPLVVSSDQKTHSDTSHTEITLSQTTGSSTNSSTPEDIPEMKTIKPRGHTISVMSPAIEVRQKEDVDARSKSGSVKEANRSGISPGFVFLQLFHNHPLLSSQETPVLLQHNETTERALRILDHIHPYETHKLGVVYVGPGQATNEKAILSNLYGSERYARLVEQLGQLICLRDVNPDQVYTGGLASNGEDGQFAYSWQDDAMQVIFHIATLMPNKNSDPNCNSKKRHIGNDYVTIIYNDSHDDYKIGTIKGSFNYVNIVIKPLDYESNAVTLQTKEVPSNISTDIAEILGHTDTKIISDENLAQLVRQIAMHCNLASMVLQRQQSQPQDPFASNWLERLRQIKRIKQKALQVESPGIKEEGIPIITSRSFMEDFTDYV
ncbi:tuberin [Patella vulgata]|uniref:tuberin n=1 Tax=Patella vulgata TaxID=6465 RepID=UPI00217F2DEB|nr:tuberin [Patella vulgata]